MPNKQKLFETAGSALMVLVLAGLIAACILAWYATPSCQVNWFSSTCSPSPGVKTLQIINAAYGLTVCAAVLSGIGCFLYGLYVWGSRGNRCVPLHAVTTLVIAAAVITFAVGYPSAVSDDTGQSATPFFNGSTSYPSTGWWIALIAGILQLLVFILYYCAFK